MRSVTRIVSSLRSYGTSDEPRAISVDSESLRRSHLLRTERLPSRSLSVRSQQLIANRLIDALFRLEAIVLFGERQIDLLAVVEPDVLALAVGQRVHQPVLVVALGIVLTGVRAPAFRAGQRADRRHFRQIEQAAQLPRFQ